MVDGKVGAEVMTDTQTEDVDYLDAANYPTAAALAKVSGWPVNDPMDAIALLGFVRRLWAYRGFGAWNMEQRHYASTTCSYEVCTAGSTGNELLIVALQENRDFWRMAWVQSVRGGHHTFEVGQ